MPTKPMYWITGNYFDCQQKWKSILSSLKDANVEVFECDYTPQNSDVPSAKAAEIIMTLKHRDLFDKRPRVIKMKGIPDDYALLTDYLRLANDKNVIVIDGPFGYRKPPSQRLIPVKATKFFKEFSKLGEVNDFPETVRGITDAVKWIKRVVESFGKTIEPDAARLMVELQGKTLDYLYTEVSKLVDYQEKKKITLSDVETCTASVFQRQVWDLLEDLARMNVDASLSHLASFYEVAGLETGTSFRGDVEMLLGALLRQFNFYLLIKDSCLDGTLNYDAVKRKSAGIKKRTSKMVSGQKVDDWETDYFDSRFLNTNFNKETTRLVSKWPWHRVYAIVTQIHLTRLTLRSHGHVSEYNRGGIKLLLDSLVLLICGKLGPKHLNAIRGTL